MRAFIATLLSDANQAVSDGFGVRIGAASGGILRPVPARSSHITHVFLGEVDDARAAIVVADLQEAMARLAPVPFELGRPEVLRAGREPRLVLAHVDAGRAGVLAVTQQVVDCLRSDPAFGGLGPARSPHVTLARFRRGTGPTEAGRVTELLTGSQIEAGWRADRFEEVQLVRSELTPKGPIYEVVGRARAGGPA